MTICYTVCRDPEGIYVAAVPNLPGCVTQAQTEEELDAKIREAANLYISHLRRKSIDLPEYLGLREMEID